MKLRLDMIVFFFFFQAEDGIRDIGMTGVQTCALPICIILAKPIVKVILSVNTYIYTFGF